MNGLEAIELMKKGRTVKNCNGTLYRIDDNCVKFRTTTGTRWACEVEFNFLAKYEEYLPVMTGWERSPMGGVYYFISDNGRLMRDVNTEQGFDKGAYDVANYFSTEEKAEEINFKQTLFRRIQRFSDENKGNEIDWSDVGSYKYYIFYHRYPGENEEIRVSETRFFQQIGQVYFYSQEIAERAIELFKEDLIKYYTHDWSKGE